MDPISPNCSDNQCMGSYTYVRSATSMNTISNQSKPPVRLKGNRRWKKSWSHFAYKKKVILMVQMMRLWSSLSFWERESDCLLGEGGFKQSSFTLYGVTEQHHGTRSSHPRNQRCLLRTESFWPTHGTQVSVWAATPGRSQQRHLQAAATARGLHARAVAQAALI